MANALVTVMLVEEVNGENENGVEWNGLDLKGIEYVIEENIECEKMFSARCMSSLLNTDNIKIGNEYLITGVETIKAKSGAKYTNFSGISSKPVPENFEMSKVSVKII